MSTRHLSGLGPSHHPGAVLPLSGSYRYKSSALQASSPYIFSGPTPEFLGPLQCLTRRLHGACKSIRTLVLDGIRSLESITDIVPSSLLPSNFNAHLACQSNEFPVSALFLESCSRLELELELLQGVLDKKVTVQVIFYPTFIPLSDEIYALRLLSFTSLQLLVVFGN